MSERARLQCDRCHQPIDDEDRKDGGLAECRECGLVFDLLHAPVVRETAADAPSTDDPLPSRRPIGRKRPQVKIPERFDVMFEDIQPLPLKPSAIKSMMKQLPYREAAQDMTLAQKRRSRPHARAFIRIKPTGVDRTSWFLACVVIPVIGLGLATLFDILDRGALVRPMGTVLTAVVLALIITLLRRSLNSTTIQLRDGLLRITVEPLSFSKLTLLADDIVQIWTRRALRDGKQGFDVELSLSNGSTQVLLRGLETAEQALYIEQELEYALGLIDVAVATESNLAESREVGLPVEEEEVDVERDRQAQMR